MRSITALLSSTLAFLLALLAGSSTSSRSPDVLLPEARISSGVLTGVAYSRSGDEFGSLYCSELTQTGSGIILTISASPTHSTPLTCTTYRADNDALSRIAEIVTVNGMEAWCRREDSFFMYDAAYPCLILHTVHEDGSQVDLTISGYISLNEQETKAWQAVMDILEESEEDARLIKKSVTKRD